MTQTIYSEITQSIIEQLEQGAAPWIKPWKADSSADKNLVSQKPYQGINRLLLGMSSMVKGFSVPVWASYKQWEAIGANVKKGEKGTKIVFYSPVTKQDKQTGDIEKYSVLKTYFVFNAAQVEGIDIVPAEQTEKEFSAVELAEQRIIKTGAAISHGGDAAFYMPSADRIQLPNKSAFDSEANYYATAFHELAHWTGSKNRLDRDLDKGRFGNPAYAFEELVAEMSAAFLCSDYGIQGELRHAGYIGHWLKALREDSKAVFKAAALAQKAADYINMLDATAEAIAA
jgi:antirestriction protein ArdC